jgi:hypothetical protein
MSVSTIEEFFIAIYCASWILLAIEIFAAKNLFEKQEQNEVKENEESTSPDERQQ